MLMKQREETKYIVIMSTGTYPEEQITASKANKKDTKNGFLNPCYHYFIETDGFVDTGRPLDNFAGGIKKHNKHSVVIKWSGGKDKRLKKLVDNRTPEQIAVIPDIIDELRELYPQAEVIKYETLIKLK